MAYRGYLALNQVEFANSARVVAHLGAETPTSDAGFFPGDDGSYSLEVDDEWGAIPADPVGADMGGSGFGVGGVIESPESPGLFLSEFEACAPIESFDHPGLGAPVDGQVEVSPGLWSPAPGARIFGPGLFVHDECWGAAASCVPCRGTVLYDDSWDGQREWLQDVDYRPELAPWYVAEIPESGEFGGVWVTKIDGLDSTPVERTISQATGAGAVAGPSRDASRTVSFEALLVACSNAGVEYGKQWLTGLLRKTSRTNDTRLRYLTASPARSAADPDSLLREAHNVVLTRAPDVTTRYTTGSGQHNHGNVYVVSWEMVILSPYAYMPQVDVNVEWDQITRQPINWIHAADCSKPETCVDMPVMFSAECQPETIDRVVSTPPVCGGCLPVSAIDKYSFRMPTMEYAFRGRETAVTLKIKNTGAAPLTLQAFWRVCGSDVRCEDNRWPLQVAGLPAGAELHLDGITGRYKAWYDELWRKPMGIVGTPNGAPWRPAVLDRQTCWDFIVQCASTAEFTVSMSMADREP